MKVTIRKSAGVVYCPILGQINRRLNRCEFTLCYQFHRPRTLFPTLPGEDAVSGMVPDWVELHFLDAIMEGDRLRIVTTREADEVYRSYLDAPKNKPREAESEILAIIDHPVYAVIDTDRSSVCQIFDNEDTAKQYAKECNNGLYRDRYVAKDISKGGIE